MNLALRLIADKRTSSLSRKLATEHKHVGQSSSGLHKDPHRLVAYIFKLYRTMNYACLREKYRLTGTHGDLRIRDNVQNYTFSACVIP